MLRGEGDSLGVTTGTRSSRRANGWWSAVGPCHAAPVPTNYFDERIAKSYEARWPELFEPGVVDPAVRFLAGLAGTGTELELGIGTGRIAIPLSRRGVRVHGIDLSPDMIAQLRAKPGTDDIGVTIGDFATTRVDGRFTLAYLLRNTIMNLTTQDGQVACFQNVAAHLQPGGCFVIEVMVPALQRLKRIVRRVGRKLIERGIDRQGHVRGPQRVPAEQGHEPWRTGGHHRAAVPGRVEQPQRGQVGDRPPVGTGEG